MTALSLFDLDSVAERAVNQRCPQQNRKPGRGLQGATNLEHFWVNPLSFRVG
jgi:hypothetical protein